MDALGNPWQRTELWAAKRYRHWQEVDDHFAYAANASMFATTGGGFGAIISKLVTKRGGTVFKPVYDRPAHVAGPDCIEVPQSLEHSMNGHPLQGHRWCTVQTNLQQLVAWLPAAYRDQLLTQTQTVNEPLRSLAIDLGARPRAYFGKQWQLISTDTVTETELKSMVGGMLCSGARQSIYGIPNTLHRVFMMQLSER